MRGIIIVSIACVSLLSAKAFGADGESRAFETCMSDVRDAIFSQDYKAPQSCAMSRHTEHLDLFNSEVQRYISQRIAGKSSAEINECKSAWDARWREIYALEGTEPFHDKKSPLLSDPERELSSVQYDLYRRAELERGLTVAAIEAGAFSGKKVDTDICYLDWLPIIVARAENVAFINANFVPDLQQGILPEEIHFQFWLVVQHADFQPEFQAAILELLEKYQGQINFNDVLLNSLRSRVKHN